MSDFVAALGLVLVIEGVVYCLFPDGVRRKARTAAMLPDRSLRIGGLAAAIAGVGIVWLVRH
ncbi:DUF2065 domain-containing protein [Aurantimonas coralicida]|uniref:DUF2065 domain-containing protein n=1 Tax=Aurantimonas coralicida TaxID=182270 RepID=UPI00238F9068|nr:DUF2065 domain-containing protein [Aurantimonas coralicida]MDE0924182.1 DUF2065 domain-containing protein [Aurantimonas coralicida]